MGAGGTRAWIIRHLLLVVVTFADRSPCAPVPSPPLSNRTKPLAAIRARMKPAKGKTMTKQQTIAAGVAIQHIPLEKLYISDLNPRKTDSAAHIESLVASVERFGLIHNLAGVLDSDDKVGIVAGACRLRAIQKISEQSKDPPVQTVPVKLAANAAEAEDWASAENAAREDVTPADEIRAFGRMQARGATVPGIALAFAVTAGPVRAEDNKAAIETVVLQVPQTTKPGAPKSLYSQKLVADMQAIRLAAVQAALLANPELVPDLLELGLS